MKIIEPSIEILNPPDYQQMLTHVEAAGRTCYQSEPKGDPEAFIKRLIALGHESVLEHEKISVRFICDRGVSHELVRHRLCSFSQESTRYCNYYGDKFGNELAFIKPCFYNDGDDEYTIWKDSMRDAEKSYFKLIEYESTPQEARSVLPNSLKTDIVVTANIRQWRTMFKQRCAPDAHPQMRQSIIPVLDEFYKRYMAFFGDVAEQYLDSGCYDFECRGWQLAEVR